jgi:hypothetical protein
MQATLCSIDWDKLVRVLSALLTPTIGVITTYIAYHQYATNKRQARLALFDKRLPVFNSVMKLLAEILRDTQVDKEQLYSFLSDTRDGEFLFGPEIAVYTDEIYKKGGEVRARHAAGDYKHDPELFMWFEEQMKSAKDKFRPYLQFPEP